MFRVLVMYNFDDTLFLANVYAFRDDDGTYFLCA